MTPSGPAPGEEPTAPAGADTLLDVLRDAASRGFAVHLVARAKGRLECTACGRQFDAADLTADRVHRLEGASDAADLLLVVEAACPRCRAGGTLTLGYGPNASGADADALTRLDMRDS